MTNDRSLLALDWPDLGSRLAAAAESPGGRALCLGIPLASDAAEARRRMAEVAELAALLRSGETLPSLAAPEVEGALGSAEQAIVLGADVVRPVAVLAHLAGAARRYFLGAVAPWSTRPPAPEIATLAETLDPP